MSHFYGGIQGGRGEATRTGHKNTGIHAYIKTWNTSAGMWLRYCKTTDTNRYTIMGASFDEEDMSELSFMFMQMVDRYYKDKGEPSPLERFKEAQKRGHA